MKSLFGLSINTIMIWVLAIFLILTLIVAVLALRNRLLFKLGLRNIPRRRAQTTLIIVGLMLSTVIITSAFSTGDTISYSVRATVVNGLGYVDETVAHSSGLGFTRAAGSASLMPPDVTRQVLSTLSSDRNVDGAMAAVVQSAPLQDLTSGQTKANGALVAVPMNYPATFGSLTTTGGTTVTLGQLASNELYIDKRAADDLSARAGDTVRLFLGNRPVIARVRTVLSNQDLASGGLLNEGRSSNPTVLLPLDRVQRLLGLTGAVTTVLVSNKGGTITDASLSDEVTTRLRSLLANPGRVASVQTLLLSPAGKKALATLIDSSAQAGNKTKLRQVQREAARPGQSPQLKSLVSDPDLIAALETIKKPVRFSRALDDALVSISEYTVQPIKKDGLTQADLFGSVFTTIFVVFGLFSIAAGILLIFLIFVMLAAERRSEMGMARAIGTKRRHLIQQFLFEGYTYDLGAALVGVVLGILVGLGMVKIMASLLGAADFSIQADVEPRSLVIAFCLGALVTFATVAFSAWRVSRLNIVAAIRDLPEDFGKVDSLREAWRLSIKSSRELLSHHPIQFAVSLLLLLVGVLFLRATPVPLIIVLVILLLWRFWPLLKALLARGPFLVILGYPLAVLGINTKTAFWWTMGVSLLVIGVAMLLRWILAGLHLREEYRNRIGFSLAGILLVIFWLLPFDALNGITGTLNGGIEMFFVSGIMLVLGGVWTLMFNADLILGALLRLFGGNGRLAPILKTAVTYPMQYKFRTGLTLAMFSLVIFTLMVMSVLTGSTSGNLVIARDTGNYQIYGKVNPNNPITNLRQTIAANPTLRAGLLAEGGLGQVDMDVRQPGQTDQIWQSARANIADDAYLASTQFTLHNRALGYPSDQAVWRTLRTQPGYAVVDASLVDSGGGFGGGFTISGFKYKDIHFRPQTIETRDTRSGKILRLRVIGVLDQNAGALDTLTPGIYVGEPTLARAGLPAVLPSTYVFRVTPGQDVHTIALAVGKAFLNNGLDVKEVKKEYDINQSLTNGLQYMLEAFMALGLVVGIAALGVIAFRSVVERRQQIGMMRAIGFQRSMIRASFLLESSFVAILGTLLGVGLGLGLARNLVASIAKTNSSVTLNVPWLQILLIVLLAYVASLITTYLPAWQASRIYPAEALRYE